MNEWELGEGDYSDSLLDAATSEQIEDAMPWRWRVRFWWWAQRGKWIRFWRKCPDCHKPHWWGKHRECIPF